MRQRATVKIDDKEYTVKELTVKEIVELVSNYKFDGSRPEVLKDDPEGELDAQLGEHGFTILGIFGGVKELVDLGLEGASIEDLYKMTPSEIDTIFQKFKEINSHFFDLAQKVNLGETVLRVLNEILTNFSDLFVNLSSQAMEVSGSMDIPSS